MFRLDPSMMSRSTAAESGANIYCAQTLVDGCELVSGADWFGGTTVWGVHYEYADSRGGGKAIDYFKTPNRYSPPTGVQIAQTLNRSGQMTVIGIETIKQIHTITPGEDREVTAGTLGESKHGVIFDAFTDATPAYSPKFLDLI